MQNPIKKYKGKNNKEYKYYSADFSSIRFRQFQSIYYQVREIVRNNNIHTVLEFGGGRNTTRALSHHMGIEHIDVSLSENMFPDIYSSIIDYEYVGKQYDMVCSFQYLEHNPFVDLDKLVSHMLKFSKKYFYISVPYRGNYFSFSFILRLPKFSFAKEFCFAPNWFVNPKIDEKAIKNRVEKYPEQFHHSHWWEVGMRGLSRKQFITKMESYGLKTIKYFHNPLMPYHLFCLFEKK